MELRDLVDARAENSVVIVAAEDDLPEDNPCQEESSPFYLIFSNRGNVQEHGVIEPFRGGFKQKFDLRKLVGDLLPEDPQEVNNSWPYNLFLTALGVARAETLGSRYVYIPESFFSGLVKPDFYNLLNILVDEGTSNDTKIEIRSYRTEVSPEAFSPCFSSSDMSLILTSGGTDSTVAAAIQRRRGKSIGLLQVTYQQAARHQEKWCVDRIRDDLDATELKRVELDVLKHYGGSALLRDDMQLREGNLELEYVPFRNSVLISIALILASFRGYSSVVLGAHPDDTMAPDGTRSYVQAFNDLLESFNSETPIVEAPLLSFGGKPELIELGLDLGVDFSHTWSCHSYVPEEEVGYEMKACGTCGNCITRYSAFKCLSIGDPLSYAEEPKSRTHWAGRQEKYWDLRRLLFD